jgi:hypothetical protein
MTDDQDRYESYYADKLWAMLPAVYRALDTDQYGGAGPLRELVNRIGARAATLRRAIDRLWEDQSIETCDDWVIPYIGDLLATNLVSGLDARARRIDVARTIYYRRRKGTLGVLEEIAANVTGWDAKVVEFFRRLGRTRHGLDPALGLSQRRGDDVAVLQAAEGLVGPLTRTHVGGLADLRSVNGASKAGTAFDEYFHTADFRRGAGRVGWYGIPRLGVFLWRLHSYGVAPTTPVHVRGCPAWFTFDPTGRDVPLFGASRTADAYGDNWVSPAEGQLPTPISQALFDAQDPAAPLYPDVLGVYPSPTADATPVPVRQLTVRPQRGRFHLREGRRAVWTTYHYGFSSDIGAGPYDRRIGRAAPPAPPPETSRSGGDAGLTGAGAIPQAGTVTIADSLTYTETHDVKVLGQLTVRAGIGQRIGQRPVIRPAPRAGVVAPWTFTGQPATREVPANCLVLDGLLLSGADVVLAGRFDCVTLTCCTLDPGTASSLPAPAVFAVAADDRDLVPCRLWIEGQVRALTVERCVTGPIRTRGAGQVETLTVTDSILQAIPTGPVPPAVSFSFSWPRGQADPVLALGDGEVILSRCTVLGRVVVHRLSASECILRELARVDDAQHGCVRFTAWADGSVLPRQYESVRIPPGAPLFTSTDFGRPGYGQLLPTADLAILPAPPPTPPAPPTILAGAEDGSEMGAFAREMNPVKERGLLIKYQEYMPAGLVPVLVYVT